MGDEIIQIVDLEYKGVYYLMKGTEEMIKKMIVGIRILSEWNHKKWLEKPGSCEWKKIQETSEGNALILEFPKEMFEENINIEGERTGKGSGNSSVFEQYCKKHGLRYCVLPDLNPDDDYIPVAVPSQEFGIHDQKIKSFMRKRIEGQEEKNREYAKALQSAERKIAEAEEWEKDSMLLELEQIKTAKEQNSTLLSKSKTKAEKGNKLELAEYLEQGEGTELFTEPEKTILQAQTFGTIKEQLPAECIYPIRTENLIPKEGELFYVQPVSDGSYRLLKRSFLMDRELAYSLYEMLDPESGKRYVISDKEIRDEGWSETLSEIMKKSGMLADHPVATLRHQEDIEAYLENLRGNFTKAHSDGQTFQKDSDPFKKAEEDERQREAFESSFCSTLQVSSDRIMLSDKQVTSLELSDGILEGISLSEMDKGEASIRIREDERYHLLDLNGKEHELTGNQVIRAVKESGGEEIQGTRPVRAGRREA